MDAMLHRAIELSDRRVQDYIRQLEGDVSKWRKLANDAVDFHEIVLKRLERKDILRKLEND